MATITITELIDRAQQVASGTGTDAAHSVLVDGEITLEVLLQHALCRVADEWAERPEKRAQLLATSSVAFTDGVGDVPTNAIATYLSDASFDSDDYPEISQLATWLPHKVDRNRGAKEYLWYFWLEGNAFHLQSGGGQLFDGTITVTVPTQPVFSAGSMAAPTQFIDDVVVCLAAIYRGEIPLAILANYQPPKPKRQ